MKEKDDVKIYPVQLYSAGRKGGKDDKSARVTLHTSFEVTSDDIKFFDESRGNQCFLIITEVTEGLKVPDLDMDSVKANMVENKVYEKNVTPGQLKRNTLHAMLEVKLGKKPTKQEFTKFYVERMAEEHANDLVEIKSYEEI